MTLNSMGRAATASILSLAMALGATSCSNDYTVAYVYMTTAKNLPHGIINAYQIDYQNGFLRPLDSNNDTGGRNTVGMVVAPNNLFLYTVNHDDSDVVEIAIGTDGKLYPQTTYNISGSLPTAAAIDAAGKFLYVTFTYQNGPGGVELYTPANPGPGGISIFPINANNSLGTPTTVNLGRNPVGIVAKNNFVYAIEQDAASSANLIGFSENPATGALTPLPGVTINSGNVASTGFATGPAPIGILADSTGTHLYVTDQTLNQVAAYSIAANGVPSLVSGGTVATDSGPMGMAFDLTGKYLYVVAYNANAIDGFTISANGQPVRSTVAASVGTGIGPTCVAITGAPSDANPSHAVYLYVSNALSNNITAEQVNETNGSLEQVQGNPFGGSTLPTCVTAVQAYPIR
jgi:6-phosphogluconolactonase (cycloisomerase 2 family)